MTVQNKTWKRQLNCKTDAELLIMDCSEALYLHQKYSLEQGQLKAIHRAKSYANGYLKAIEDMNQ
jgi:hypothetical protein